MKRTIRWAALTAAGSMAAVLAFTGCAPGTGGAGSDSAKELTYWSMYKQGEPAQVALQSEITAFTKQTGIKVNVQWQGRGVLKTLQPTLNTTPAADVIDRPLWQVESIMGPSNSAADMAPILDMKIPGSDQKVSDVIDPRFLASGKDTSGKQVVLPYEATPNCIWYDGNKFPDLTAGQVSTWNDFLKVLDASRSKGAPLALDADVPGYTMYWYTSLLVHSLGADAALKAASDKTGNTYGDPGYVAVAKQIESLVKGGYFIDGYNASKFPAIQQKWAGGKANFLLMASWVAAEAKPYAAPGMKFRCVPFPNNGGTDTSIAMADTYGWVIPTKATHTDAARQFVAFMYGKDQVAQMVNQTQAIVTVKDAPQPDSVAEAAKTLNDAKTVVPLDDGVAAAYGDWNTKVYGPLVSKLLTGGLSADQFSAQIRSQTADYWKNQG